MSTISPKLIPSLTASSHIEQVLGYVESEHVVDSITFFS